MPDPTRPELVTLFLCGDVMLGRGIDQILPHPGDPRLYEPAVASATTYVELAERAHGPILRSVDFAYVWGEALEALRDAAPDLRIINLETSITRSADAVAKGINYKMDPDNAACLSAAGIDACVLANNHVLDWGRTGLLETLATLERLGVKSAGAGRDAAAAEAPAVLPVPGRGRVLVFAFGPNTNAPAQRISTVPAQEPERQVEAPLPNEARQVAVRFIQTAVARENLEEAWELVGPNLRGGLTRKEWLTGNNPVVPFPVDQLDVAPYKVDEAYETSALMEVALLPRKGSGVRAQVFFLGLKKVGSGPRARWVVDNWVPRASAVVPR